MNNKLLFLKLIANEDNNYNKDEIKNLLSIEDDKILLKTIITLINVGVIELNFNDLHKNTYLIKLANYITEFDLDVSSIDSEKTLKRIYSIVANLNKKKRQFKGDPRNNKLWNYLFDELSNNFRDFFSSYIPKDEYKKKNTSWLFLNTIVYELRDIKLLKSLLNSFPKIVNTKNDEKKWFIKELVSNYIDKVIVLSDDNIADVIYYDSVIDEFLNSNHTNFQCNDFNLRINASIDAINHNHKSKKENKRAIYLLEKLRVKLKMCNRKNKDSLYDLNFKYNKAIGFSNQVLSEAINLKPNNNNFVDMRNLFTITIDGDGSRNLDDAISLEKLSNGNTLLYIHIADVARYVSRGSVIDLEAFKRGQTIYLKDNTIPMLPSELGYDLCSLKNNESKYATTCILELEKDGEIKDYKFTNSLINVNYNLHYTNADDILKNGDKTSKLFMFLKDLEQTSNLIGDKNHKKALKSSLEEIINMEEHESNSCTIICNFMLLYNNKAAEKCKSKDLPFIYRVHEMLNIESTIKEIKGAKEFFESQNIDKKQIKDIVNKMIVNIGAPYYSEKNLGFYELGFDAYSHSSSPIRRYSDLYDQRIIKDMIIADRIEDSLVNHYVDNTPSIAKCLNLSNKIKEQYVLEYQKIKRKS